MSGRLHLSASSAWADLVVQPTIQSLLAMDDVSAYLRRASFVELFEVVQTVRVHMGDLIELHDAILAEFARRGIQPPNGGGHVDNDP